MNIEQLLEQVTENIEDKNMRRSHVGNRPHYPIFVAINGASSDDCSAFCGTLRAIWTEQISRHLLIYQYKKQSSNISFYDVLNNQITIEQVYDRISASSRTRDVFEELDTWCFYNIINVDSMESFDEFLDSYNALNEFKQIIHRNTKSMVIIILKDSRDSNKINLNFQVRQLLMNENQYDGTMLISNLSRGSMEYEMTDVYNVISNVVLLSNNDAITELDDGDYSVRNLKLYSKTPLIVSYSYLKKPISKILYNMTSKIADYIDNELKTDVELLNKSDLFKLFGIEDNQIIIFAGYIEAVKKQLYENKGNIISSLQSMPLKKAEIVKDIHLLKLEALKKIICHETYDLVIKETAKGFFVNDECQRLINQYTDSIYKKITLRNVDSISPERINELFSLIQSHLNTDYSDTIIEHFIKEVLLSLLRDFICPYCLELILKLCKPETGQTARINLKHFCNEIRNNMPISVFEQIPEEYGKQMNSFLHTEQGSESVGCLLKLSNCKEDLYEETRNILLKADEYSRVSVNVPYIKMWAGILKLHGTDIFRMIRKELVGEGEKGIMLNGEYPISEVLSVYMLHCYDRNGENETELYKQFKEAYRDVANVQFFNTGNDDSIESIKFYKCSGTSLILGLNEAVL